MSDSTNNSGGDGRGRLRRLWDWFWSPLPALSVGFTLIAGFLVGILFWGGFHSMETNLGEYRETSHYNNHSGVRAICSDCHVPNEWNHKIKAKVMAVKDVYHELAGTINSPEKYEEHRLQMASAVWKKMKASDSRECRNCHEFEYMDFTIQEARAAAEHQRAIDNDMTCIDCHQGIAHSLPPGYLEEYQKVVQTLDSNPAQNVRQSAMIDGEAIKSFLADSTEEAPKR